MNLLQEICNSSPGSVVEGYLNQREEGQEKLSTESSVARRKER